MKTYKSLERMFNIINRASEECNYIVDESDELINILGGAIDALLDGIEYDRISVAEMSNHHSFLWWTDEMGYSYETTGELMPSRAEDCDWYRYNETTKDYDQIKWYDATEDDFVAVDRVIDSEGQVVLLISK